MLLDPNGIKFHKLDFSRGGRAVVEILASVFIFSHSENGRIMIDIPYDSNKVTQMALIELLEEWF